MTRAFNSFLRHGTIRPLTAIVITLIFVMLSFAVILAQFSSSRNHKPSGYDFSAPADDTWTWRRDAWTWRQDLIVPNPIAPVLFPEDKSGAPSLDNQERGTTQVVGVGVYWDANCSLSVNYLDWGSVFPGSLTNITVFIRNEGNEASTLFIATDNWKPSNASNFITLNWDYDGHLIYPQQTTKVMLTLSVVSNIYGIKDFNFDMIIGVNG